MVPSWAHILGSEFWGAPLLASDLKRKSRPSVGGKSKKKKAHIASNLDESSSARRDSLPPPHVGSVER